MRDGRGEFESRNRQLPADLNQSVAFASSEQSRRQFETTPVGTPVDCYDVRSVWDVRPVGAFDFNIVSFIASSGATDSGDAVVEMTVPDGFVAILRNFDAWFSGTQPAVAEKNSITWSLQLNGGDVPYNADVPMGVAVDRETVFLIGNEFNRIGLRIASAAFANTVLTPYVRFYGTLIIKSSRALPFEVANPTMAPNCGTSPRMPTPKAETPQSAPPKAHSAPIIPPPVTLAPAPPPMAVPPYPIRWRTGSRITYKGLGASAGQADLLIPVNATTKKDLSVGDVRKYAKYLDSQVVKSRDRIFWENFLQYIGVNI